MPRASHTLGWIASLSDAARARALRLLDRHELSVAELCRVLQLPQSTASRHLKALVDDGWIDVRSEGTSRFYRQREGGPAPAARRVWAALRSDLDGDAAARRDDARLDRVLSSRQTRSQLFFTSAAGRWSRLRAGLFGAGFDLRFLPGLLDERTVVGDLGCGTGELSDALSPFVGRVIAVDASAAMLRAARRRLAGCANVELRQGALDALPLDDASLDAAVLMLVLHHVPTPERALAEVARVLRPGGRALLVDMLPHDRVEYRRRMGHQWQGFAAQQVEGWLDAAGFSRVVSRSVPPDPSAKGPPLFAATAVRGPSPASSLPPTPRSVS